MTTRTITLCAEHWQLISDALLDFCDEGPPGEGWKSPGLSSAVAALDAALDEPEPEGLTDEQALADFTSWLVRELPPGTVISNPSWWAPRIARAVLARWGRPAIEPVPVSERPWEREGWCDSSGRCWWWNPATNTLGTPWWSYSPWEWVEDATYSLPHYALPVPQQQQSER